MMNLNEAIIELARINEEIELLEESADELEILIERLTVEESGADEIWSEPDDNGARVLLPAKAVYDEFIDGDRAEQYWAKTRPIFHNRIVATLTEYVDPRAQEWYSKAFAKNMGAIWAGMTFSLAYVYSDDGIVPGIRIPLMGNFGPYRATQSLIEDWTADDKVETQRELARQLMKRMDWRYGLAQKTGTVDAFLKQWPHYEPE